MSASNSTPGQKKSSFLLVFCVVIVFIIAIGFLLVITNSKMIKDQYYNAIAVLNAESNLQIQIVEYQPGYLCSHAQIFIPFNNPFFTHLPPKFNSFLSGILLDQTITHGPWLYDASRKSHLFAPAFIQSNVYVVYANQTKLEITQLDTLVTYQNEYFTHINVPQLNIPLPHGQLSWGGLNGLIFFNIQNDRLKRFRSDINVGLFNLQGDQLQLSIESIKNNTDFKQNPLDHWNGEHDVALPHIMLVDNTGQYRLDNLDYHSEYHIIENDSYTHLIKGNIAQLATPEITFSPVNFSLNVQNLNAKTLDQLVAVFNMPNYDSNAVNAMTPLLIKQDTILSTQAEINSSLGAFSLHEKAYWPPNTPLPVTIDNVIQQGVAEIDIRISIALLNQLITIFSKHINDPMVNQPAAQPQTITPPSSTTAGTPVAVSKPLPPPPTFEQNIQDMIARGIKLGYILQEQNDYVTTLTFDHGILKINGKAFVAN